MPNAETFRLARWPMAPNDPTEQAFGSTTWAYRPVKIKRRPQGTDTARAKRGRWYGLATWPRQRRLTLQVQWRGGAESYWLVTARGRSATFTGHDSLEDVMAAVCNEWSGPNLLPGHRGTPPTD